MQCTKCRKEVKAEKDLSKAGLCFDCALAQQVADFESERKAITVEQLLDLLSEASSPDDVADAFAKCDPPTDKVEQERLREKFVRALEGKLKRPGAFVDAWLNRAPADETARIAKEATRIVALALEHAVLFHDRDQEPYAYIQAGGHQETHRVSSRHFKRWLAKLYWEDANAEPPAEAADEASVMAAMFGEIFKGQHSAVPSAQAMRDALLQLEGLALFEGEEHEVHIRVAELGEYVYLDLADEPWRAVEITRAGWKVIDAPPVRFVRPEGMLALPEPVQGGSVDDLRVFLNVADESEDDWPLIVGFVAGLLRPRGPYPVLEVLGEQGSAKSSAGRFIRRIVDPYNPLDRGQPRSEHDLVIAASRQWVMAYDNLSWLPDWLSDAFSRISTGGGFGARALYTDDEEKRFNATRPIIVNGIEDLASRGDLLDRAIIVTLQPIEDDDRREEGDLEAEFAKAWPGILGAVLDATCTALARIADVRIDRLPRMADFTKWVVAAEPALGIEQGSFLEAYRRNREAAATVALEASMVAVELRRFMEGREQWEGIATDLLRGLNDLVDEDVRALKEWPKTGRGLSGKLRRLAPALRRSGIRLEFERSSDTSRTRMVTVTRTHVPSTTEYASDRPDRPDRPGSDDSDGSDGLEPTPSPPGRVRTPEPELYPEGDGAPAEGNGYGDESAIELLKTELGAVDAETLDFIDEQRRGGADFTSITSALRRMGFPPPPGRQAWDLAATVMAYGIRHP
jgi:hypothetical protein